VNVWNIATESTENGRYTLAGRGPTLIYYCFCTEFRRIYLHETYISKN